MEEIKFIIKKGFILKKPLELVINKDFINFENLYSKNNTVFQRDKITEYRFGVRWIRLDLAFGREYFFFVRSENKQVLKINFRTYFGYKTKYSNELYHKISINLWNFYFNDIVTTLLNKHDNLEDFNIGDIYFSKEGINIKKTVAFKLKDVFLPWEEIRTQSYYSYFAIYSSKDPANINVGYSYANDWNTNVLYSVLRTILSHKNIESYT